MSALWDYMSKEHGLNLLGSEIDDILALARQEIELPEIHEAREVAESIRYGFKSSSEGWFGFIEGFKYALRKVRNPYPKPL